MKKSKISIDGDNRPLGQNPFETFNLQNLELSEKKVVSEEKQSTISPPQSPPKNLGRIEIRREKAGRGGKTVTTVKGIEDEPQRETWLKTLQRQCACGGCIKGSTLEIQGDKRDEIAKVLQKAGFRVVFTGG